MALASIITNPSPLSLIVTRTEDIGLVLDYPAMSIVRMNDSQRINLCNAEWEYFIPDGVVLRLIFWPSPVLQLIGHAVEVDPANVPLVGRPLIELTMTKDGSLVYECPILDVNTASPRIRLDFVERRQPLESGRGSSSSTQIIPPCEATPKLIFKPKRSSPTGGSNNQPTMDIRWS